MEKKQPSKKKAHRINYEKEDLVWEAVRRHEHYKTSYNEVILKKNKSPDYAATYGELLRGLFQMNVLCDPAIDIDQIQKKIADGADPKEIHPYYGFFRERPVIIHDFPQVARYRWDLLLPPKPKKIEMFRQEFYKWFRHFLEETEDRIVVSINPMASNDDLKKEIIRAKSEAIRNRITIINRKAHMKQDRKKSKGLPNETEETQEIPEIVCRKRDISAYIAYLKKYDEVVAVAKKKADKYPLETTHGVILVPKDFDYYEMVHNNTTGRSYEGQRRAYKDAYQDAIKLIATAPFLVFSAARIQ